MKYAQYMRYALLLFCIHESHSSWLYTHKKELLTASAVVGTGAAVVIKLPQFHTYIMDRNRQNLQSIPKKNYPPCVHIQPSFFTEYAKIKEDLQNMWTLQNSSFTLYGSVSRSGTIRDKRVFSFNLNLSGSGVITYCFILNNAHINGDFIIDSCQIYAISAEKNTRYISCNNSLVRESITVTSTKTAVIELENSIVMGDIRFDTTPGTIIIDKDSIIQGKVINGIVVRKP